ncbi:MAG: helix-turn-helix transcriptional regulator [Actinomycetales bacterium]
MADAATRALRLLDLVPYLKAHPGVSLKQISEVFKVSTSELIADLNLLFLCGLPGYTPLELIDLSVDDGTVVLRDAQNLDAPRNFTESESLIVKIALAALSESAPAGIQIEIANLLKKMGENSDSDLPSDVVLFLPDKENQLRRTAQSAIGLGRKIVIAYRNETKDTVTKRTISLIREYEKDGKIFWESWCHLVNAKRTFNLERIISAEISNDVVEVGVISGDVENFSVKLRISKNSLFLTNHHNSLRQSAKPGEYEIMVFQKEWIIREVLSAAGTVEVLSPTDIRARVRERALEATQNYQ